MDSHAQRTGALRAWARESETVKLIKLEGPLGRPLWKKRKVRRAASVGRCRRRAQGGGAAAHGRGRRRCCRSSRCPPRGGRVGILAAPPPQARQLADQLLGSGPLVRVNRQAAQHQIACLLQMAAEVGHGGACRLCTQAATQSGGTAPQQGTHAAGTARLGALLWDERHAQAAAQRALAGDDLRAATVASRAGSVRAQMGEGGQPTRCFAANTAAAML